jgi:hypothetical protein
MCEARTHGLFNFTNKGAISLDQILAIYRDNVAPTHTWETSATGPDNRPACALSTAKLEALFPGEVPEISETIKQVYLSWKK